MPGNWEKLTALPKFAFRYISIGLERLALYTYPGLVVLGGAIFQRQRITPRLSAAVLVSLTSSIPAPSA